MNNYYWINHDVEKGDCTNYEEFINTIFSPKDKKTFEEIIGYIALGTSMPFDKCVVISGPCASGKSTLLYLLNEIFIGYNCRLHLFDDFSNSLPTRDPKIMIIDDFDPKRIENDETFHAFVTHEPIVFKNRFAETYKRVYSGTLFAATNSNKEIEDAITLHTTGERISPIDSFNTCVHNMLKNEIGHIIHRCVEAFVNV